ncbi:hypothetical protein DV515_00018633, partial [Chloebia gouldiae]
MAHPAGKEQLHGGSALPRPLPGLSSCLPGSRAGIRSHGKSEPPPSAGGASLPWGAGIRSGNEAQAETSSPPPQRPPSLLSWVFTPNLQDSPPSSGSVSLPSSGGFGIIPILPGPSSRSRERGPTPAPRAAEPRQPRPGWEKQNLGDLGPFPAPSRDKSPAALQHPRLWGGIGIHAWIGRDAVTPGSQILGVQWFFSPRAVTRFSPSQAAREEEGAGSGVALGPSGSPVLESFGEAERGDRGGGRGQSRHSL